MQILISLEGDPEARFHEIATNTKVRDLTKRFHDDVPEAAAWVVDHDEALSPGHTLGELKIAEHDEILIARRTEIEVTVEYNRVTKQNSFPPQRKMRRVFDWAAGKDGFALARDQRPEHVLVPLGSTDAVDPQLPVAAYADRDKKARFELRRKDSYQGTS